MCRGGTRDELCAGHEAFAHSLLSLLVSNTASSRRFLRYCCCERHLRTPPDVYRRVSGVFAEVVEVLMHAEIWGRASYS